MVALQRNIGFILISQVSRRKTRECTPARFPISLENRMPPPSLPSPELVRVHSFHILLPALPLLGFSPKILGFSSHFGIYGFLTTTLGFFLVFLRGLGLFSG